jgi:geranylgeranyl pyrophosphate synthase
MVGGQVLDLTAEGTTPTEAMVARIHHCKTGALIVASALAGAALAGATESVLSQLSRYAEPLGFAFQIVDDVLELTQSAETLGKPVGSDLKHGKATYPGAVGLEAARRKADALVREATDALREYPGDPTLLLAMADVIISRDS